MTGAACAGRKVGIVDGFDAETAAREVADALRGLGMPERAAQEKRYLKSDLEFFGVTVPETRRAGDEDFWIRRSAILALLPGVRAGRPDLARFTRYAEPMLTETEFFIRKAIGWVLREISRRDPVWVAFWTEQHLSGMSG